MNNLLDNESGIFYVLMNNQREYSLWPKQLTCPAGWDIVFGPENRADCLQYTEQHWLELKQL